MITNGEFVSRILQNLRAITKDGHISKRFILNIGRVKASFLMAQKLDELTLFKEDGIITSVPCFRLESVEVKTCEIFDFRLCSNVMKSVNKIPPGIFGKNGSGIISVMNVDETEPYHYITPQAFTELRKRKYTRDTTRYYTIKDGHIFLPNSRNELLELRMVTTDKKLAEEVSDCVEDCCKPIMDYEFICPDRFIDLVVKDTLQEVGTFYRTSIPDENPNMDENQKSKTVR
jgi:hypothetical protein